MIVVEIVTIKDKQYQHTYSDAGFKVERDGIRYDEAFDPIDSGRVYVETDECIEEIDIKE